MREALKNGSKTEIAQAVKAQCATSIESQACQRILAQTLLVLQACGERINTASTDSQPPQGVRTNNKLCQLLRSESKTMSLGGSGGKAGTAKSGMPSR